LQNIDALPWFALPSNGAMKKSTSGFSAPHFPHFFPKPFCVTNPLSTLTKTTLPAGEALSERRTHPKGMAFTFTRLPAGASPSLTAISDFLHHALPAACRPKRATVHTIRIPDAL